MKFRSVAILACALSLAGPLSASSAPQDDKASVLRALAARVGHVLGAASACPAIPAQRIQGITAKITEVIKSGASQQDDEAAIFGIFNSSTSEGARAVITAQTDCGTADRELADLENAATPGTAPATRATQSSTFTTASVAGAVRGISANEIRFGSSLPLTGPNKEFRTPDSGWRRDRFPQRERCGRR